MYPTPTKLTTTSSGPLPPLVVVQVDRAAVNIPYIINNLFPEL
jgi:hypothetical protein